MKRNFYARDSAKVARELLGKKLVHKIKNKILEGRIVETEAYYGENDPASHAFKRTPRSEIMYGPPGFSYVYFVYGNHHMFNVVTEKEEKPGAVLIRALEPLKGLNLMKKNRGISNIKNLTNGPGKLTKAFDITKKHNNLDLSKGNLKIKNHDEKELKIVSTKRIGIKNDLNKNLRFYIKENEFLSKV